MAHRRLIAGALATLVLSAGAVACGGSPAPIEAVELADLPTPIMVQQIAVGLRRPYLVELPARPVNERYDLKLGAVGVAEALDAIEKLDPAFQVAERGGVLAIWPAPGKDLDESPFSRRLTSFQGDGGAGDVLRRLLVEAGLGDTTDLIVQRSGLRRPVKLALADVTVRDAFLEVAAQAHVGFFMEPGKVNVGAVPE